jgi:hypothetical protein
MNSVRQVGVLEASVSEIFLQSFQDRLVDRSHIVVHIPNEERSKLAMPVFDCDKVELLAALEIVKQEWVKIK